MTGVHDLVHALVELEQDGIEVERSGDLFADFAEQLDAVLLRRNLGSLRANLLRARVDRRFESLRLSFERSVLRRAFSRSLRDEPPGGDSQQQKQQHIENIGERGPIPRRQDRESKLTFGADLVTASTRAHSEAIISRTKTAVVRLFLIGPVGPSVSAPSRRY